MSKHKHYNNIRIDAELLMECLAKLPPLDDERLLFNVRFVPEIKEQLAEYGEAIETVEFSFKRSAIGKDWQLLISELTPAHLKY